MFERLGAESKADTTTNNSKVRPLSASYQLIRVSSPERPFLTYKLVLNFLSIHVTLLSPAHRCVQSSRQSR